MNQIKKMLVLFVFLFLISRAYAQDFSLSPGKFYGLKQGEKSIDFELYSGTYNMCQNEEKSIPIMVVNKANIGSRYSLDAAGPGWASLNANEFALPKKQSGVVFLNLNPGSDAEGKYSIKVNGASLAGNIERSLAIDVSVEKCHSLSLELEKGYDRVCGGAVKKYTGKIANEGNEENEFELGIQGPNWISMDENKYSIDAGGSRKFEFNADIPAGAKGVFDVFVSAAIKSLPSIKSEKKLSIEVVPKYGCYKADFVSDSKITNYYSEEYILIKIKNDGIRQAGYKISLDAPDWVSVDAKEIAVNPQQYGGVNLHLNPGNDVPEGTYTIKINANFGDIAYSKNIDVVLKRNKFADVKSLFVYYQYYIYVLLLVLVILFILRRQIKNKIKTSYKNYRVRKARLKALKAAREARQKAKEAKKPEFKTRKFSLKWFLISLIAVFSLLFFSAWKFDFPFSKEILKYYYPYFITGILISLAIILLIEFYRPLFRALEKIGRRKK